MQYSLILLSKLTSMMLMAAVGYVLVKLRIIKEEDDKLLSSLLVYALQPCLIFLSLQIELTPERGRGFIAAVIFAFACMVIAILTANLLKRPFRFDAVDIATMCFANVGNLMLPVVALSLGDEMTFYCSGFQLPFNLIMWTYGFILMSNSRQVPVRKILCNPNLIALFIGLFFLVTGLHMPSVIDSAMQGLKNMVAGSSMLLVGIVIAGKDLKSVFTNRRAYFISFFRLIAIPLLTILLLYATGFLARHPQYTMVLMAVMLSAAAPGANSVVQLAVLNGRDAERAGAYNVLSTILCVLTVPLVIFIYQRVFPM